MRLVFRRIYAQVYVCFFKEEVYLTSFSKSVLQFSGTIYVLHLIAENMKFSRIFTVSKLYQFKYQSSVYSHSTPYSKTL